MNLLIGALTTGLVLGLLGLGVLIGYRVFRTLDLTADGAFGIGAAVAAALAVGGTDPLVATGVAVLAGAAAGWVTGVIRTKLLVSALLAGVLTSTALYSVCLFVMGSGNLSLASVGHLGSAGERIAERLGMPATLTLAGDRVAAGSVVTLVLTGLLVAALAAALTAFFGTELGTAMRAVGTNPQMARSVALDVDGLVVLGLCLSNGLIALSGALFAQYSGFANIQMGIGAFVGGLANLMLGEALLGRRTVARSVAGAVAGAVAFRLLVAVAVRAGLDPNALKLVTAALVLAVLAAPRLARRVRVPAEGRLA